MEECLEAMLEEEWQHERNINSTAWSTATGTSDNNTAELCQQLSGLKMQDDLAKQVMTANCSYPHVSIKRKVQDSLYQLFSIIINIMKYL